MACSLTGCEKTDSSLIDPFGAPPVLLSTSFAPNAVNLDSIPTGVTTIQFIATARIGHSSGVAEVSQVSFALSDESGTQSLTSGTLNDIGQFPDLIAGDSIFSARITVPLQQFEVGKYYCTIVARDQSGYSSNMVYNPLYITRINHIPILFNLQAPDTISISNQTQSLKLAISAADSDGLSDIVKVFFNTFKPDNSPSSGNPFLMYDDGIQGGDAVKSDGIYTLTIGNPTVTGSYRFEFQAVDRSNAISQKLIHFIVVVQ